MYADDTVLFFSARCPKVIETTLNSQLSIVNDWLQDNLLFLNVKKTEVVLFGTSGNLAKVDNFTITIGQKQIKRVMEYKYLGVVMDDKLSWKSQIAYIVSKTGKRIGLLGRIRKQLTTFQQARYLKHLSDRYLITVTVPGQAVIRQIVILWSVFREELQELY